MAQPAQPPQPTALPAGARSRGLIPPGHKVALRDLAPGHPVRRYNQVIGYATQAIAEDEGLGPTPFTAPNAHHAVGALEASFSFRVPQVTQVLGCHHTCAGAGVDATSFIWRNPTRARLGVHGVRVRVREYTVTLSWPACTKLLADHGGTRTHNLHLSSCSKPEGDALSIRPRGLTQLRIPLTT